MSPRKILICGLPGTGKSTLARELQKLIPGSVHYDGDTVRMWSGNRDFSLKGRYQQACMMGHLCDNIVRSGHTAIASFICPTNVLRRAFGGTVAPIVVWLDVPVTAKYPDTTAMFETPIDATFWFRTQKAVNHAKAIQNFLVRIDAEKVKPEPPKFFSWEKPSAVMIGRFQPWHSGHRALFERALADYGQVCILVRQMPVDGKNPKEWDAVREAIVHDLEYKYRGRFCVTSVPNTAAVVYGRDVGYDVKQYRLDKATESVSGTLLRKHMAQGATGATGDETWNRPPV